MKYSNIIKAQFISRPNRFTAIAAINGKEVICHIKNTGRLTELLQKDAVVYLTESSNPMRKTQFDLVATQSNGEIFNIDSQSPNIAAKEYLQKIFPECIIKPEVKFGSSRFDFYVHGENKKSFVEVKGVTLIRDGIALFPDAPTERGIKHINELILSINEGYEAYILFVVQTENVTCFSPNDKTHRQFGEALRKAQEYGVNISAVNCIVTESEMTIKDTIPIKL